MIMRLCVTHRGVVADDENDSLPSDFLASVEVLPSNHRLGFSIDTKVSLSQQAEDEPQFFYEDDMTAVRLTRSDSILRHAKFKISDVAVQVSESLLVILQYNPSIRSSLAFHGVY